MDAWQRTYDEIIARAKAKGYTLTSLAKAAGRSRVTLFKARHKPTSVSAETIVKLCRLAGLRPGEVYEAVGAACRAKLELTPLIHEGGVKRLFKAVPHEEWRRLGQREVKKLESGK